MKNSVIFDHLLITIGFLPEFIFRCIFSKILLIFDYLSITIGFVTEIFFRCIFNKFFFDLWSFVHQYRNCHWASFPVFFLEMILGVTTATINKDYYLWKYSYLLDTFLFCELILVIFCHLIFFITRKFLDRFQCFSLSFSSSVILSHTFHPIISQTLLCLTKFTDIPSPQGVPVLIKTFAQISFSILLTRFCK